MITLLTTGSRGDTQPYIALGLALKKAGHTVRVAAFENFADFVTGYGLEYYRIPGDVSRVAADLAGQDSMKADNPLKFLLSFSTLKDLAFNLQKNFYAACEGSDAIIYHPGAAIGYFAAQELKIPAVLATPFPMATTAEYPSLIFYDSFRLGKTANIVTHKILQQIMWFASSSAVKDFWKQEFGRPPENFGMPFPRQNIRDHPTIISCSEYVFPRPADWSEHIHQAGYWFLDEAPDWQPPADLLDFLHRGEPPVYVGFGSVGGAAQAAETTALVTEALRLVGQRGILATGWSGLAQIDNPHENILMLESAPHSWLFPQMAAVVHHGGAGTTAAGLRAGVPGVLIPFSNDQFAWGRRVYELGVGAKPIPRKKLSSENLADAIRFALGDDVKRRAAELGAKIRSERGAENAANILSEILA